MNSVTFGGVSEQYSEASYQQTSLIGKTVGWYTLAINSTESCDSITNKIQTLAPQAAAADRVDVNPYIHRVYIFPRTSSCGWAGLGSVGRWGAYSHAWLNGYNNLSITGHELAHNICTNYK